MVDIASIVVAILALIGTVCSAIATAWFAFYSDDRKRASESEKVLSKYRDPLLLATQDLQSRLYNLTENRFVGATREGEDNHISMIQYTCFLVGQFFSWIYILRREAQFLHCDTDRNNKAVTKLLSDIAYTFGTDTFGTGDRSCHNLPLMLWRCEQRALGEVMTVVDNNQLYCMGFTTFHTKWEEDLKFRPRFRPIADGLGPTGVARGLRFRHLQHLLVDLIHVLDPDGIRSEASRTFYCRDVALCSCSNCSPGGKVQSLLFDINLAY